MGRIIIFLLVLLFPLLSRAQEETAPRAAEPVALRSIPAEQWDDAAKGLDYSKDVPKPPKEREPPKPSGDLDAVNWTAWTKELGTIFQVIAIILAVLGIGYGIYRMMQEPRNRVIARDGVEITAANIDAYIHETDLDRFLREALSAGNYVLAIRLYYLQILKTLSAQHTIAWSREKTNRDYLREMRQHRLSAAFRSVTLTYERLWYGNQPLDAQTYEEIVPEFKNLLEGL